MPGTGCLCKLLACMVGLVVILHATSCGFFFCVQFPHLDFRSDIYEDLQDISVLAGEFAVDRSNFLFLETVWVPYGCLITVPVYQNSRSAADQLQAAAPCVPCGTANFMKTEVYLQSHMPSVLAR